LRPEPGPFQHRGGQRRPELPRVALHLGRAQLQLTAQRFESGRLERAAIRRRRRQPGLALCQRVLPGTERPVNGGMSHARAGRSHAADGITHYRDLLFMLTWRDIKIRYKQSVMGFLWAVLMPILIIGSGLIVTVAFSTISGRPVNPDDVLSVAVKAVPWAFFVAAIRFATNSLVMNKELVTKIYFPREILPVAAVLANCFDFAVAASVVALVFTVMQVGATVNLLWLPVLLGLLILLTAGFALLL